MFCLLNTIECQFNYAECQLSVIVKIKYAILAFLNCKVNAKLDIL